jgi:hypothetical protein
MSNSEIDELWAKEAVEEEIRGRRRTQWSGLEGKFLASCDVLRISPSNPHFHSLLRCFTSRN